MTKQERNAVRHVARRLQSMISGDGRFYKGDVATESQSIFIRSWILPYLNVVAMPAAERNPLLRELLYQIDLDERRAMRDDAKRGPDDPDKTPPTS